MYQEEAICNREIYKNAEINVLKLDLGERTIKKGFPAAAFIFGCS